MAHKANIRGYNKAVIDSVFKTVEFKWGNIIIYDFLVYRLMPVMTEELRNMKFPWKNDTYNLKASIGAGIYNMEGELVSWSGGINPVKTYRQSRKHKRRRIYPDGNQLLYEALNTNQISSLNGTYSIRIFVAMPYGYYLDDKEGYAWLDELGLKAREIWEREYYRAANNGVLFKKLSSIKFT